MTALKNASKQRDPARAADDAERVDAVRAARAQMSAVITREFERVARLVRAGFYDDADARLTALEGRVRECAEFAPRAAELRAQLAGPALQAEREASRVLDRLLTRFYPSGGEAAIARELARFADEHPGTQLAERARAAARLVLR